MITDDFDNFILDENNNTVRVDFETYLAWMKEYRSRKRVALWESEDKQVCVSTVFLSVDYSFGYEGTPVLFETMVFGGIHDQFTKRYSTWDEAQKGHEEVVKMVHG